MMDHSGIVKSAKELGVGVAGLVLITFAAVRLGLQPGAVSLLYLIAVVFVSLGAGLASSIAVSLVAVFLLQYYFVPLFSPPASKNDSLGTLAAESRRWARTANTRSHPARSASTPPLPWTR